MLGVGDVWFFGCFAYTIVQSMPFFTGTTVDTPQLLLHRQTRARHLGLRVCRLGIFGAGIGAVFEWAAGSPIAAIGNLTIVFGSLLSRTLTLRDGEYFYFGPIYLLYWLGGAVGVYATGGLYSPYLVIYIVTLYLAGILLQTRFTRKQVSAFCLSTVAIWGLAGVLGFSMAHLPTIPAMVHVARYSIYALSVFVLMEELFHSEEAFVRDIELQSQLLRTAQADMAHAEKLAQVGKLIATTAHEFAQPVQVITMSASMLGRGLAVTGTLEPVKIEGLRQFAANIQEASTRLARLLNQLREISRKEQFSPKPFDWLEALHSVESMVRHDFVSRGVRLRMRLPKEPIIGFGDVMNAQQIVFNLISNGRDAAARAKEPIVEVDLERFGNWARILIHNSGPGIPVNEQSRVFDPYFTTKRRGEGTGLGLPVCLDLVTLNRGRIFFCSDEDSTTFVVDLPRAEDVIGT